VDKKSKILFIYELNYFNLIISFFFRIFKFKIFFFHAQESLRSKKFFNFLKKLNIIWASYYNLNPEENLNMSMGDVIQTNVHSIKNISQRLIENNKFKSEYLPSGYNDELKALVDFTISYAGIFFAEFIEISKKTLLKNNSKIFLWAPNNLVTQIMLSRYKRIINLQPRLLSIFILYISNLFFVIRAIIIKIFLRIKNTQSVAKQNILYSKKSEDSFNTGYYTDGGLLNQNTDKMYFYNYEKNSRLYPSNIIHFERDIDDISRYKETLKMTLEFYEKYKINYLFWRQIKYKKKLKDFLNILKIYIFFVFKIDNFILFNLLVRLHNVQANIRKLENFKLKTMLVGNDRLFPMDLAVACRMKNIKIIAHEDRMITQCWGEPRIFDAYFVHGDKSIELLKYNHDKKMEIIKSGNVFQKSYFKEINNVNLNKHKEKKLVCLIADYHSHYSWYQSGTTHLNNYATNLDFAKKISFIIENNPEISFRWTSKNYEWTDLPVFEKIYNRFKTFKNLQIMENYELTNNQLYFTCDFAITKYGSITDLILSLNKPALIFESIHDKHPSSMLPFYTKITSSTLDDLNNKVKLIKNDLKNFNESLNSLREKIYVPYDNNKLQDKLNSLII